MISQFSQFRQLMIAGLQLLKIEHTSLAKSVFDRLGLTAAASATNVAIQIFFWIRYYSINNFK